MAYIGKLPATQGKDAGPALKLDDISSNFNGTKTVFDLTVGSTAVDPHINNIAIYLSGVYQIPGSAFSLSGSQVVFTAAPSSSLSFHGSIIGDSRIMTPDNNTIEPAAFTSDTATSVSGSWQGVVGSGSLGMVSGSAISTGSFGAVNVAGMSVSNVIDVSSSIASRTSTLEGTGTAQGVGQSDAVTFSTVNTGQGANELYDMDQNVKTDSNVQFADITSTGTITAQQIQTEFVSASITLATGSNIFGDNISDSHQFTGSILQSGSFAINKGSLEVEGKISGSVTSTGSFGRVIIGEMGNSDLTVVSSSVSTRATTLENANISGGFVAQTVLSGSGTLISGSVTSTGSFGSVHTAGNVGIGTTAPDDTLTVQNTDSGGATSAFGIKSNNGELNHAFFTSDADGGYLEMYKTDGSTIGTRLSGYASLDSYFNNGGNVGIGTSSPGAHLDVSGSGAQNIKIQSSDDNSGIVIASDPDEGQISFLAFAAGSSYKSEILYDHDTTAASQALKFKVGDNAVTAMTILGDGKIGIGETAPSAPLEITGSGSGIKTMIKLNNNRGTSQADGDGTGILVEGAIADNGSSTTYGRLICEFDDVSQGTIDSSWRFKNYVNNNELEVLSIIAGNAIVGSPANQVAKTYYGAGTSGLTVYGANQTAPSNYANLHVYSEEGGNSANAGGVIGMGGSYHSNNDSYIPFAQLYGKKENGNDNDYGGYFALSTVSDGGNHAEAMRVTSAGKVGIGTTSVEDGQLTILRSGDNVLVVRRNGSDGEMVRFMNGGSDCGSIDHDGSGTAYNTSSDYRLKIIKGGITDGLDRLLQLNPVRFNFKDYPDVIRDGFLAHEVQSVIPEAVTGEKDAVKDNGEIDIQMLDNSKLVPLLVASVQELSEKVEELESKISGSS